jgi:hypothetical protein
MAERRHLDARVTTLRERRGARLFVGWIGVLALLVAACGGDDDGTPDDGQGVDIEDEVADDAPEADDDLDADDTDDADDPDADASDEATEEDDDPADGEDADEDADAADGDASDEDAEATDEDEGDDGEETDDGAAAHRAPEEAAPDCDAIEGAEPGATIAFPSADGEGWQEAGASPATVEVVGCSNTFEANVQYEVYHGEDAEPTVEGHTMGGTMGDWGEFRFEETFWTPGEWRIVVFEMDAESGDRREYDEQTFVVDES